MCSFVNGPRAKGALGFVSWQMLRKLLVKLQNCRAHPTKGCASLFWPFGQVVFVAVANFRVTSSSSLVDEPLLHNDYTLATSSMGAPDGPQRAIFE